MSMGNDEKNKEKKKNTYDEQQLVVFEIAGEEFGVNINEVKEIIRWEEVTRIPNTDPYIKGVINLRGNIIVINDLAMKLGLPSKEVDDDTRILVVEVGDNTVGMVVDSATEVLRLEGDKIREAPSMVTSNIDSNYIQGVGLLDEKRLLTLLDLSKVLESKDYQQITQIQKTAEKNIKNIKDVKEEKTEEKKENIPTEKSSEQTQNQDEKTEKTEEKSDVDTTTTKEKNKEEKKPTELKEVEKKEESKPAEVKTEEKQESVEEPGKPLTNTKTTPTETETNKTQKTTSSKTK